MISAGVPVALATDINPGSCNSDSMPFIISIACIHMKMTVAEAICAATVNAAWRWKWATAWAASCLASGRRAVFDMPSYRFLPYHIGSSHLRAVLKAGQVIWEAQA
jgi:imidazolonepropionase